MKVVICGPNLNDQSKGDFHVHAEGCADLKRSARREPAYRDGWTVEAATREDVTRAIYEDQMAEDTHVYDPATGACVERTLPVAWQQYDQGIFYFPCVAAIDREEA